MTFRTQEFIDELSQLIAFRSISSDQACSNDTLNCASWLQSRLENLPAKIRRINTDGYPLIVARIEKNPSYPTVAIYNHYDVQPIAAPDLWQTDPFELCVKDDRWYGRGASDNKGNLVTALHAVELALAEELKLNLEFIYEGEEESGSANFRQGLDCCSDFLKPDCIVVADGKWLSRERPSINYGARGSLYMHWNLRTAEKNVHSGSLGGVARNPLAELMSAFVQCYDSKTMRILIPGIYDNVREPSVVEVNNWMEVEMGSEELIETYKLRGIRTHDKEDIVRSILAKPTLEVHGCIGGDMRKDGKMTIIPSEGQLQLSMRLVSEQDPTKIFAQVRNYLSKINPDIEVCMVKSGRCYSGDPQSNPIRFAVQALHHAFGRQVSISRMGSTVGALAEMKDVFNNCPIFLMSFSLPSDGAHSANEFFEKEQAEGGVKTLFEFFRKMETLHS
jgi:acetylornithine deacetylase/succinyl-diaminopimelate desuccinylase-like protein